MADGYLRSETNVGGIAWLTILTRGQPLYSHRALKLSIVHSSAKHTARRVVETKFEGRDKDSP